jgi:hypothetical protein
MIPSKDSQKLLNTHKKTLKTRKKPRLIPFKTLKKLSKILKTHQKNSQKSIKGLSNTEKIKTNLQKTHLKPASRLRYTTARFRKISSKCQKLLLVSAK